MLCLPGFAQYQEVAENWGTYVSVHSYSAKAIQNAISGGVREGAYADLNRPDLMLSAG